MQDLPRQRLENSIRSISFKYLLFYLFVYYFLFDYLMPFSVMIQWTSFLYQMSHDYCVLMDAAAYACNPSFWQRDKQLQFPTISDIRKGWRDSKTIGHANKNNLSNGKCFPVCSVSYGQLYSANSNRTISHHLDWINMARYRHYARVSILPCTSTWINNAHCHLLVVFLMIVSIFILTSYLCLHFRRNLLFRLL